MPRINEMLPSKYLKKEDCEPALLLTIRDVVREQVGMGDDLEDKWICYFEEKEKGVVLNSTNMRLIEMVTGSDDSDDWIGKKIVLYNEPNVSFAGKLTGGIRVRAPKVPKPGPGAYKGKNPVGSRGDPAPNEPLPAEADSDVPF